MVRKHLAPFLLDETSDAHDGFDQALRAARRELIRRRLPRYDLLVLDEAHKLKNPSSKRFQYLEQLLIGRFETMLFLTATPFQIDLKELAAVFRLLSSASGRGSENLAATAQQVIEHANRYRQRFDQLEQVWRFCPSERACAASDPGSLDAHEQLLHGAFSRALESRDVLAGELVKVMLRERRSAHHRRERVGSLRAALSPAEAEARGVDVGGAGRVVFAASVRLFHEMRYNRQPTFDPVVLQSLTSSYDAYRRSPVRARATRGREPFLASLIDSLSQHSEHPKIVEVVASAAHAAASGEKTLIFTERIETAQRLANDIGARLTQDAIAREEQVERGVLDAST